MKWKNEYLSDEELKMLISEVEQTDMVAAPPEIAENILSCLLGDYQYQEKHEDADVMGDEPPLSVWEAERLSAEHKRKEYRNYCFRVWTSVAAALIMVFLLPKLMSLQPVQESRQNPKWSNDHERQEKLLAEWKETNDDKDSNDRSIFNELFSGSNLFGNEDRLNLFSKRNGG